MRRASDVLADIERICPGIGHDSIQTQLARMLEVGDAACEVRGRAIDMGAAYQTVVAPWPADTAVAHPAKVSSK